MGITEDEYKGHKILIIEDDLNPKNAFRFGLRKAELVLRYVEELRDIVEKLKEKGE